MNCGYANRKRWRIALLVALGLFFLTRILTLTALPIFNDEAIYLQYSQRVHENWEKNKFVSMNGEFTDWKPPLQYWLAAPFIECGDDPVLVGRVIALLFSTAGFFGIFLFAKELFTEREGVLAAVLYALCPPVLLHNDQFTAEAFLFSTAPVFYWALLKAMRWKKWDWIWAIAAVFLGMALVLFKQSGFSLVFLSLLLPMAHPRTNFGRNFFLVGAVVIVSLVATNAIIPSEFDATREHFNRRWVLSLPELAAAPVATWRTNLNMVCDYISATYSWAIVLFFSIFTWLAVQRRNVPELMLTMMCLAGAGGIIFFLRGFNEYLFNTAVIAILLPLLARLGIVIGDFMRERKSAWLSYPILFCAGLMLLFWGYQDILMSVSPGKYFGRSSRWARANYLQSWSTGFGIKEIISMLEKEKAPGIIFADTQWGNPRTALEIYRAKRFPNLRIVPISQEFLDPAGARKLADAAKKSVQLRFAIFSADRSETRAEWITNIEREMCETRTEMKLHPGQTSIVVCQF
jgi:4-amino-4-deoxy-L-arabinose transferase-like glycosyltransferase